MARREIRLAGPRVAIADMGDGIMAADRDPISRVQRVDRGDRMTLPSRARRLCRPCRGSGLARCQRFEARLAVEQAGGCRRSGSAGERAEGDGIGHGNRLFDEGRIDAKAGSQFFASCSSFGQLASARAM